MKPSPSDNTTYTDNQPQPKTANLTQPETDVNQILSTSDSTTSNDRDALDKTNINIKLILKTNTNTEDGSNIENEANVTKEIQNDVAAVNLATLIALRCKQILMEKKHRI